MRPDPGSEPLATLHRLQASPRVQGWLEAMTDALEVPLLLVDASGRLLNANPAGQHELDRGTLLVRRGHAQPVVVPAQARLARSFAAALAGAARSGRRRRWQQGAVLVAPLAPEPGALAPPGGPSNAGGTMQLLLLLG